MIVSVEIILADERVPVVSMSPNTSKVTEGLVVPMPTRKLVVSKNSLSLSSDIVPPSMNRIEPSVKAPPIPLP